MVPAFILTDPIPLTGPGVDSSLQLVLSFSNSGKSRREPRFLAPHCWSRGSGVAFSPRFSAIFII